MTTTSEPQLSVHNYVASSDLGALVDSLVAWGYAVLRLDGTNVRDRATLLAQVAADMPMMDECRPHNWSSFEDCLATMVFGLERPKIALVWSGVRQMVDASLGDFVTTMDALATTTRLVYDGIVFITFLVDDGPSFPRWPPAG